MDGSKRELNPSLQRNLNRWILSAMTVFALLASIVSGWVAFDEAKELQDNLLQQVALMVNSQAVNLVFSSNAGDPEDALVLQRLVDSNPHSLPIPANIDDGLHTLDVQGISWRILVYTKPSTAVIAGGRFAISQQTAVRDEVAWQSSLHTLLSVLLLAPLLMAIVSYAVHRSFTPLRTLAAIVDKHDNSRLDALPNNQVPQEIIPFIASINRLLMRLRQAIVQQQRFVADAAHELRTPVTAISLLAENLGNATTLDETRTRLIPVLEGLARMRTLVSQLLNLARLQGEYQGTAQPVALQQIVRDVIADLFPLAEAKSIDLGMPRSESLTVLDISGNLRILVHNAVENAIRHTPSGGQVDVSLFAKNDQAVLLVEDSGSGIPEAELAQVFEPFYRADTNNEPGSGLGLTISQEIAQRLGGVIKLNNRPQGGLTFQYQQALNMVGQELLPSV